MALPIAATASANCVALLQLYISRTSHLTLLWFRIVYIYVITTNTISLQLRRVRHGHQMGQLREGASARRFCCNLVSAVFGFLATIRAAPSRPAHRTHRRSGQRMTSAALLCPCPTPFVLHLCLFVCTKHSFSVLLRTLLVSYPQVGLFALKPSLSRRSHLHSLPLILSTL